MKCKLWQRTASGVWMCLRADGEVEKVTLECILILLAAAASLFIKWIKSQIWSLFIRNAGTQRLQQYEEHIREFQGPGDPLSKCVALFTKPDTTVHTDISEPTCPGSSLQHQATEYWWERGTNSFKINLREPALENQTRIRGKAQIVKVFTEELANEQVNTAK